MDKLSGLDFVGNEIFVPETFEPEVDHKEFTQILYHLDSMLRLMGYGREYYKIVLLVNSLYKKNPEYPWKKFFNIYQVLKKEK